MRNLDLMPIVDFLNIQQIKLNQIQESLLTESEEKDLMHLIRKEFDALETTEQECEKLIAMAEYYVLPEHFILMMKNDFDFYYHNIF